MTARTRGGAPISGQATEHSIGKVKNIIAVASGKGGVGKSTSSVNLAYALKASGSRVGLLDADIYGPSLSLMTKIGRPDGTSGQMIIPPEVDGIKVISVAMFAMDKQAQILRGPMVSQIIRQFLTQIEWGDLDYLLIDYPPGTGDIQLTLSQLAPITGAVIITTPQEVALLDVRRAAHMFHTMKVPVLGVIETMSYFLCDGCDKKHYIFRKGGGKKVANELGVPLIAEVPIDPSVSAGSDSGDPVVKRIPESSVGKAYIEAAGGVASQQSIVNLENAGALQQFSLVWQ